MKWKIDTEPILIILVGVILIVILLFFARDADIRKGEQKTILKVYELTVNPYDKLIERLDRIDREIKRLQEEIQHVK